MAINLKTEEGFEFSFDTVEELMEFTQRMNAVTESTSDEGPAEDETEVPESEPKFEVGDEVRVVENSTSGHVVGTIGEIVGMEFLERENRWSYVVHPTSEYLLEHSLRHKESDLELNGIESKVEVGDKVRIVSSEDGTDIPYHFHDVGRVGKVVSLQLFGRVEVEIDNETQYLLPHHYEKLETQGDAKNNEPAHSSSQIRTGDIVRVTEEFEDTFGDRVYLGGLYSYDENLGLGEPFVGSVFLGDNRDKIELACRAEDRLDI